MQEDKYDILSFMYTNVKSQAEMFALSKSAC